MKRFLGYRMDKVFTGFFYLCTFVLTLLFCYLAEHLDGEDEKRVKFVKTILYLITILIPSTVAGLRADTVGVDVNVYVVPVLEYATSCSSIGDMLELDTIEPFYSMLVYVYSRFTNDAGLLLCFLQLLVIGPLMIAFINLKNKISITFGLFVYLFVFYNISLNMMRQMIAGSFLILFFSCIYNHDNIIKKIIAVLSAFLFHKSTLIGLFCLYFVKVMMKFDSIKTLILSFSLMVLSNFTESIYHFISTSFNMPLWIDTYASVFIYRSIDKDWFIEITKLFFIAENFYKLTILITLCLIIKSNEYLKTDFLCQYTYKAVLLGTVLYMIVFYAFHTTYGYRISFYLEYFQMLLLSTIVKYSQYRRPIRLFLIPLIIVYWVAFIIYGGNGGSNIYEFRIEIF